MSNYISTFHRTVLIWTCLAFFFFGALILTSQIAYADLPGPCSASDTRACAGFIPLENFSDSAKLTNLYSAGDLGTYINKLFFYAISLGALLAVLRLAWAGYLYMSGDMFSKKEHAKEIIKDTTLGLLLLLSVYLILYQINPNILSLEVNMSPLETPASTPASSGLNPAVVDLQTQHLGDTETDPQEYTPTLSLVPVPGHYCFPKALSAGNGYACLTNETNCNRIAQNEGAACTFVPTSSVPPPAPPSFPALVSGVPANQIPSETSCSKNASGFARCTYAQFATATGLRGSICGRFFEKGQIVCGFSGVAQCEATFIDVGFGLDLCQLND